MADDRISEALCAHPTMLGQLIDWPARIYADRPAIIEGARSLTFRDVSTEAGGAKDWAVALGARTSQRWAVREASLDRFVPTVLGLLQAGCVVSPIPDSFPPARCVEVDRQARFHGWVFDESDPAALALAGPGSRAKVGARSGLHAVVRRRSRTAESSRRQAGGPVDLDPALIMWTSGSTGAPRGAVLEHHAVLANLASNVRALGLRDSDRTLVMLPIGHAYGLIHQVFCHLLIGATLVGAESPIVGPQVVRTIETGAVTTLALVPPMLRVLADAAQRTGLRCPSLRLVTVGAARAEPSDVSSFRHAFPHAQVAITYGLTEAGPRVATRFVDDRPFDPACVGVPNPNVQVRTATAGAPVPVAVRSRSRMAGCVGQRGRRTRGWLPTGDLGTIVNGELHLCGRSDRLINRGGVLVAPEAIEAVLREHPAIRAVTAHGLSDTAFGEIPVAQVQLFDSVADLDVADLYRWCSDRLSAHETPAEFRIVQQIADGVSEKVRRLARM